jgi:hypothetical protein
MVKTTGIEFKRFVNDEAYWPDDAWFDGTDIYVGGECFDGNIEEIPDDAAMSFQYGVVFIGNKEVVAIETHFKRWKRKQTVKVFLAECDIARFESVVAAITAAGGKLVK